MATLAFRHESGPLRCRLGLKVEMNFELRRVNNNFFKALAVISNSLSGNSP